MSQAGAINQGGSGPNTGDFVINTPIVTGIDCTVIGTTVLFTPAHDFVIQTLTFITDAVSPDNMGLGQWSIGYNSPTYDNESGIGDFELFNPNAVVGGTSVLPNPGLLILPSGIPLYINISQGADATTLISSIFLSGSYI